MPPSVLRVCRHKNFAYEVAMLGAQLEDHLVFLQNHAAETRMLDGVPELQFNIP